MKKSFITLLVLSLFAGLGSIANAGTTVATGGNWLVRKTGWIGGTWIMMHRNEYVTLKCSPCNSLFTVRYETEYWQCSGGIVQPTVSGNISVASQSGTSNKGTCTGTGFPAEKKYNLTGTALVRDNESGCCYNLGVRNG